MINYFNQILDQYDEKQVNEKIASLPELPTNDSDYALILVKGDEKIRKYPINNAMNVALSFASYEKNASKLNNAMNKIASTNLANTLDLFGIKHRLPQYVDVDTNIYVIKKEDELQKKHAEEKTHFAIEDKLPIDTVYDLTTSVNTFLQNVHSLPHKVKKEAAFNFVKRASELGLTSLPSAIYEYCAKTPVEVKQMKAAMLSRTMNYPMEGKKLAYQMIESVKTAEDVDSLVDVINGLDKKFNIIKEKHPDLSKTFYTSKKTASAVLEDKLKDALDNKKLNDYLDKEIISSLENGDLTFNSLNPRTQKLIETVINYV